MLEFPILAKDNGLLTALEVQAQDNSIHVSVHISLVDSNDDQSHVSVHQACSREHCDMSV